MRQINNLALFSEFSQSITMVMFFHVKLEVSIFLISRHFISFDNYTQPRILSQSTDISVLSVGNCVLEPPLFFVLIDFFSGSASAPIFPFKCLSNALFFSSFTQAKKEFPLFDPSSAKKAVRAHFHKLPQQQIVLPCPTCQHCKFMRPIVYIIDQ